MRNKIVARRMLLAASVVLIAFGVKSADCTWTGKTGDGNWSTPGNWDALPAAGDTVTIDVGADDVTITIGEAVSVGKVRFNGSGRLTLEGTDGGSLTVTETAAQNVLPWQNACTVVCNLPVALPYSTNGTWGNETWAVVYATGELTFNREVTATATRSDYCVRFVTLGDNKPMTFNGKVTMPDVTVLFEAAKAPIYLYGEVSAYGYNVLTSGAQSSHVYCHAPMTLIGGNFQIGYRNFHTTIPGVFGENVVFDNTGYVLGGVVWLDGNDQTINRMASIKEGLSATGHLINSDDSATLTLKASQSDESNLMIKGRVSIVYDALDSSFVQTFFGRENDTAGALVARNGTLKLDGGATFISVPSLSVAATGAFEVGETNGVANPLPALQRLDIARGGKLKLPAGVALTPAAVRYGASGLAAGTYTSDGRDDTNQADWIDGMGMVTLTPATGSVTYWAGAADGDWNVAANWTAGVPSGTTATIDAVGGGEGYTVFVSNTAPSVAALDLTSTVADPFTLAVTARLPFTGTVGVGKRATLAVGTGGVMSHEPSGGSTAFALTGGQVDFAGDAVAEDHCQASHLLFDGYGTVTFAGTSQYQACMNSNYNLWLGSARGSLVVKVEDDAAFHLNDREGWSHAESLQIGTVVGGTVHLSFADNAQLYSGNNVKIATANSTAILSVGGSARVRGGTFYGTVIADAVGAKGTLRVTGGLFDNNSSSTGSGRQTGLIVGNGSSCTGETVVYDRTGTLEITDGIVSNYNGFVNTYVGQGSAEGFVRQSGGLCETFTDYYGARRSGLVIGFRGGKGEYDLSGGRVGCLYAYIGGAVLDKDLMGATSSLAERGGFGFLKVSGGEFAPTHDILVSSAGEGEIRVSGGAVAAENLILTNSVDAITGKKYVAKLSFALDETGACGSVTLSKKLKIAEGSKLTVDLGGLATLAKPKVTLLTSAQGVEGAFAPDDVTFVGEGSDQAKIFTTATSLGVKLLRGMVLIVR